MAFGIALSVKSRVRECTPALLYQMMDARRTAAVCAEIHDALEQVRRGELSRDDFETLKSERKRELPILTPHAMFPSGRRRNEDAVPSGLSMYDIDHIADPRGYFQSMVADRVSELGVVMAHVTPSTEGLRLVFVVPQGMTLEEAQRWMSRQLSDGDYDGCVKDLARCSFLVPRDYVLYLDEEELFTFPTQAQQMADVATKLPSRSGGVGGGLPVGGGLSFKGTPYSTIVSEYWRRTGGEPQEGERNVRLHRLAVNLRAICDNRPDVLLQVMPRYGLTDAEMEQIVASACKEPPKGVSKLMKEILAASPELPNDDEPLADDEADEQSEAAPSPSTTLSEVALPLGLRESLVGVPEGMQMAVLCAVLPIAATYADQVEVEYCDGNRQRLGLMSIILGDQASGKSVCKQAVDVWKRPLEEDDALARQREEEWRERKKKRKANERVPDDPKALVRVLPVTVSCSTLLRRLKNARGHTLYSFGEELDTLRKTNGAGSWSSKYDIYRLSFDHGEWGQDYNSDQAESGVVRVAYNWTLLGTYGAMRKCFRADNIENGLSSRVIVAEMPDGSFSRMPHFGRRSFDDEQRIREAAERLRSTTGFIDTPRLREAIGEWVEQKRLEALRDIDRVKDTYRKRAAVIGFRAGVIHCLLEGHESDDSLRFATLMADYVLWEQTRAFGETFMNQYAGPSDVAERRGRNHTVFDQLPAVFAMADLRTLKQGQCGESALRTIITRWAHDGWIERADTHHWRKMSQCYNATMLH